MYVAIAAALLVATGIYAAWWFQPQHIAPNSKMTVINVVYFGLLSLVVWRGLAHNLFLLWLVGGMRRPKPRLAETGSAVAMITCFVPGKEPLTTLEACLRAMVAASYPHDTWVLDEGDSAEVRQLCGEIGVGHFSRSGQLEYNTLEGPFKVRSKGGNHNAWYDWCAEQGIEYDYVCQLDVDFVCQPDILEATLGYFRDPQVATVITPQVYGNTCESIIARGASQHTLPFYGALQMALYGREGFTFMIGANHVIRVAALRSIGGYAPHIVEDLLTSLRLFATGWRAVYVPRVLAVGEGPTTWTAFLSQQLRWAYGGLDVLFRHVPRMWRHLPGQSRFIYVGLLSFYFVGIAQALGVALAAGYFLIGWEPARMDPLAWAEHALPAYAAGWTFMYWLQLYNVRPKEERNLGFAGMAMAVLLWPVLALAFFKAVRGTRLQYAVTPKGKAGGSAEAFPFHPHVLIGSISVAAMAVILVLGRSPTQALILWIWTAVSVVVTIAAPLTVWALRSERRTAVPNLGPIGRKLAGLRMITMHRLPSATGAVTALVIVVLSANALIVTSRVAPAVGMRTPFPFSALAPPTAPAPVAAPTPSASGDSSARRSVVAALPTPLAAVATPPAFGDGTPVSSTIPEPTPTPSPSATPTPAPTPTPTALPTPSPSDSPLGTPTPSPTTPTG